MSTRRKINRILKDKGLAADVEYDGSGASRDEYGWWTVTLDKTSTDFVRLKLNEPQFTGSIEFCELEEGFQQLSELPEMESAQ